LSLGLLSGRHGVLTIAFFSWKFLENKIDKIFSPTHDFFFQETSSPEFLLGEDFCVNATVYRCGAFCPHGCIFGPGSGLV
jgi:hypothetical protein